MSKERARRRAERLAVAERERARRARRVARRQRWRALVRTLTPRRRRTGRLMVRSRGQRVGITLVPLLALTAVWLFVPEIALRIILSVLLLLMLPAAVVVVLGRR